MSRLQHTFEQMASAPKTHATVRKPEVQARGESGPVG